MISNDEKKHMKNFIKQNAMLISTLKFEKKRKEIIKENQNSKHKLKLKHFPKNIILRNIKAGK